LYFNVGIGFILRSINAFCLEKIAFKWRMIANAVLMLLGLLGLAFSKFVGFWFALLSVLLVGGSSNFGESVLLGYMKRFPADTVGGWSSGTGMAGVAGAALYLAFVAAGLSNFIIFLIAAPTTFIYLFAYFIWIKEPPPQIPASPAETEPLNPAPQVSEDHSSLPAPHDAPTGGVGHAQVSLQGSLNAEPEPKGCRRLCRVMGKVLRLSIQLLLVYFFEYVASVGSADLAVTPMDKKCSPRWEVRNAYIVLSFCYQAGVFLSRSSLKLIKIKWIEIVTALQGLNFILWMLQDVWYFMDAWVMFPVMVQVGLLGGASYVNTFYLLLHSESIKPNEKELAVNLTALHITVGITLAAAFSLLMKNTFLKPTPFVDPCP